MVGRPKGALTVENQKFRWYLNLSSLPLSLLNGFLNVQNGSKLLEIIHLRGM